MSKTDNKIKIAIIGAGPVSLALANILQNNNIPFTVFEASSSFRTTGGSLDLHPESGQLAMKEAGLWQAFMDNSRPEADCDKVVNLAGEILWDENAVIKAEAEGEDKFNRRPEIDRHKLMKILFENLKDEGIAFGKKLKKVEPSMTSENKYTLHFVDGTKESDFDLVVGGDGAWSKVRPLLTTVKPLYSGVSCLEVWSEKQNPWLREYVGVGSMFAFGKDRAIQSQTQGDGSIRSYAVIRAPEDFMQTCGIDWNKPEQARKDLMDRYFSHIGHDLQRVILESKDEMAQRPLYELPVDFTWPHRAGITLIGDAAHVMTPFAGVGVNVGLTDSLILAREIIKASRGEISLDEGLKAYEVEMFPRAQKNAEKTLRGKEGHLSEGGAERFADMVKSHKGPELTLGEPLQHNH